MNKTKAILVAFLIIWGILTRTVFHVGPNVEFVTAASLIAGLLYSKSKWAFFVPILIMLPSDLIIGNTNIFLFTWSGFLFPVVLGKVLAILKNKGLSSNLKQSLTAGGLGLVSTLFFFVWTNFGHWLTTNMYAKDLSGLVQSYINAIPFLKPQLAGNLIIVPVFVFITLLVLKLNWKSKAETKLLNK